MKPKKTPSSPKEPAGSSVRRHEQAYGNGKTICMNGGCVLRKKAKCFGFEGCPGFKGR
ncbi:MAG: hypothetical protein M0Z60_06040 [Nitrospiraceae bacterium]|nr:hypothetical protein [Nitrospiraceae bacterium]